MYLREARWKKNLTQIELAIRGGLSQTRISMIERGYIEPRISEIKLLANVLELKPTELEFKNPPFGKSRARVLS